MFVDFLLRKGPDRYDRGHKGESSNRRAQTRLGPEVDGGSR